MPTPYIIAEAAQGYEGSRDLACLLVRAAAAAQADAVKFQIVYASDLAVPEYKYFNLFKQLEMDKAAWEGVRKIAAERGLEFIADVFGPRSFEVARGIDVSAYKIHSTSFFDVDFVKSVLATGKRVFVSVGGIEPAEIEDAMTRYALSKYDVVLMFGYQAEPTPVERNNLARIAALRGLTGLPVGFMDHSDGAGEDTLSLSAMALALGVDIFEKHIGLDRSLELEDFVSALSPVQFAVYSQSLRRLKGALGEPKLALGDDEKAYRARALKKVVAAADLVVGTVLDDTNITLSRPATENGLVDPRDVVGRTLKCAVGKGQAILPEMLN